MHSKLKQLRELRVELEEYRPQTGLAKWSQIFGAYRVAGQPRAVAVARRGVLLADFVADEEVSEELKALARRDLERLKTCAAMCETVWLDQKELRAFLVQYRENDYRELKVEKWAEEREKNSYPYGSQPPTKLWRVILGSSAR